VGAWALSVDARKEGRVEEPRHPGRPRLHGHLRCANRRQAAGQVLVRASFGCAMISLKWCASPASVVAVVRVPSPTSSRHPNRDRWRATEPASGRPPAGCGPVSSCSKRGWAASSIRFGRSRRPPGFFGRAGPSR